MPLIVIHRSRTFLKHEWRDPAADRTLPPLALNALRLMALAARFKPEVMVWVPAADFSAAAPSRRIFRPEFEESGAVGLRIDEPDLRAALGTPRRRTIPSIRLEPWSPLRILVNGRSSSSSGQIYRVNDYHLIACRGPAPAALPATALLDLQADLL